MKKIVIVFLILQSSFFYAQSRGGGNSQQRPQNSSNGKQIKFSASKTAGIFFYDAKKVVKKIKIKNKELQVSVKEILNTYNNKIKEISFINSENFKDIDAVASSMEVRSNTNSVNTKPVDKRKIRENINKLIKPIRDKVKENEIELNASLSSILSEIQNEKWLKFQEKKKKSLQPKRPTRSSNFNSKRRKGNQKRRQ